MGGFYMNGLLNCLNKCFQDSTCPCLNQPYACTSLGAKATCNSGSYIDLNGVVQPCPSNCSLLSVGVTCTICSSTGFLSIVDGTCVSSCPDTFIKNTQNQSCQCRPNSFLFQNQCFCDSGFIDDGVNCVPCPKNCNICSSQTQCTTCLSKQYLFIDGSCVSSCPTTFVSNDSTQSCTCRPNSSIQPSNKCLCNTGFVDIGGDCLPCPKNCNICSSQTQCTTCQSKQYLFTDGSCVSSCPTTFVSNDSTQSCDCRPNSSIQPSNKCLCNTGFVDIGGNCMTCPTNCNICSSQTQCTTCQKNYYLFIDGSCVSSCPTTFISNDSTQSCVCRSNSSISPENKCLCNTGFVDLGSNCCQEKYYQFIDGTCVSSCPTTFVSNDSTQSCDCRPNSSISPKKQCLCNTGFIDEGVNCVPCPSNCDTCSSETQCTTCQEKYYLFIDGTCVSSCPSTFISNDSTQSCVCRTNSSISPKKQCLCNTGFVDIAGDCVSCPINCDICLSQTQCTTCQSKYYLFIDGTCVSSCPTTFVSNDSTQSCDCRPNSSLSPGKQCLCNTGFIDLGGNCVPCPANCNICSSQTQCTTCQEKYYLFIDGTCISSCPTTFISNDSTQSCVCRPNSSISPKKQCLCNTGFVDIAGDCVSCPINCDICSSQTQCTTCQSKYYLFIDGTCVASCPTTFVSNDSTQSCDCRPNSSISPGNLCACNNGYIDVAGSCLACTANCLNCASQKICKVCTSGYYLFPDGTCVNPCPPTFVIDKSNQSCTCRVNSTLSANVCPCNTGYIDLGGDCLPCGSNCDQCSTQSTCTTCSQGYFLFIDGSCVSKCPPTFTIDSTNTKCICRSNSSLQNKTQTCPCNVQYLDVLGICQQCPSNCDQCSSQLVCKVCSSGFYLAIDNTCVSYCPTPFVKDQTNTKCICRPYSTLQKNTCPCNTGYIDLGGNCLQCGSNCDQCSTQTTCTACSKGYFLFIDGTCVSNCPSTFTVDSTNTKCICRSNSSLQNQTCPCNIQYLDVLGVCQQCPSNCDQCSSQTACKVCTSGFYLTIDNTCVSQCPTTFVKDSTNTKCICRPNSTLQNQVCPCISSGYIDLNDVCQPCSSQCEKCSSQTVCVTCIIGYYLTINASCSSSCPTSFIQNPFNRKCVCLTSSNLINGICIPCDSNCQTCSVVNNKQCTSCFDGFILKDSTCLQQYQTYNSTVFTKQKIQLIKQITQTEQQISSYGSIGLSAALNVMSSSSFGVSQSGLTFQRLSYLILVKTNFPAHIFQLINSLKETEHLNQSMNLLLAHGGGLSVIKQKLMNYYDIEMMHQENFKNLVKVNYWSRKKKRK
ncbi:hypothetical protein TTHERM_01144950 (macronuclear) [Tetrahymena thermophila SB210]|uniref:EGF-like domain-containing protein n=1 Tax=Tetrahymena thermophila (strain SB210) TaxID=312017 RepID=Q24DM6_TETTS|nr:hypothetical protein TTHERM_01144950 [Tetrahymena thermophila SB210]EAS05887.3 hypothetical protein TTHERM_01144950 [Tetrahymena thermophila SB210]|eukprot:XP_001026132.3 hypothetical protein TTHERM_01144950 [Tetrahymena thermophila SB210]